MEESIVREGLAVELVSRVQLRAILSGLAAAVGCFAVCMGFSGAIGLSTFQPTADHARGLALGNVVWGAIALWISIFFGAWVAALVGRSPDVRSGVLHGLVVWGSSAGLLGLLLLLLFSSVAMAVMRLSASEPEAVAPTPEAIAQLAHVGGVALWLYWAGIVGGLLSSIAGGWLGARSEGRAPRRIGVRIPAAPAVPQPA